MGARGGARALAFAAAGWLLGCNSLTGIDGYEPCEGCEGGASDSAIDMGGDATTSDGDVGKDATPVDGSDADSTEADSDADAPSCLTKKLTVGLKCTFADTGDSHATCETAANDICTASCYSLGVGPVAAGTGTFDILCYKGLADKEVVGWPALSGLGACSYSTRGSRACMRAAHLYGYGKLHASAVIVAVNPSDAVLSMIGGAVYSESAYTWGDLTVFDGRCTYTERDSWGCDYAAQIACTKRGHKGGYGPVDWVDTTASSSVTIVCME